MISPEKLAYAPFIIFCSSSTEGIP